MRIYRANTVLSLNVRTPAGTRHVTFTPQTLGTSILMTEDAVLQEALERHPAFNRRFFLIADDDDTDKSVRRRAHTDERKCGDPSPALF